MRDADDEMLARALVAKDPLSATVAWERFTPLVRRILRRALGPAHNVEDLVQEVFLRLFLEIHQLREPRALRGYIISIATLAARSELRRRRALSWLGFFPDPAAFELRVVELDTTGRQALQRFYELLDRFDTRDRLAYVLRCIEGMSLTEVSEALGISLATTKRSLSHVQERLARHIAHDPLLSEYLAANSRKSDLV